VAGGRGGRWNRRAGRGFGFGGQKGIADERAQPGDRRVVGDSIPGAMLSSGIPPVAWRVVGDGGSRGTGHQAWVVVGIRASGPQPTIFLPVPPAVSVFRHQLPLRERKNKGI